MSNPRVVIIGAGILGTSAAYRLARRIGGDVTVIDRATVGTGTTATSMAWLNASNKTPRNYFDLNFAGLRENYAIADEIDDHSWIHATGSLVSAGYTPGLEARAAQLQGWGYAVEVMDARTATERHDPSLSMPDPDELFVRYADEGWVDGRLAAEAILGAARAAGARFLSGVGVVGIDGTAGAFTVRLADGSRLPADIVVNAAGPGASAVADLVGSPVRLIGTAGLVLRLRAEDGLIRSMILTGQSDIRADGPGFYRIHSDAIDDRLNAGTSDRDELVSDLLAGAQSVVPGFRNAVVTQQFSAVRPMPEDTFSSIGAVTSVPGYYEMITHSGITFGPLFGRIVADRILDGSTHDLLTPEFSPDRFRA